MSACRRRSFLSAVSTAAAGAAAAAVMPQARAIEPIVRTGTPQFKFSLAAYSYRDLLTGKTGNLKLDDFIDDCAKFGLEGTELTSYYFPAEVTDEQLCDVKSRCFRSGLGVSGTAVRNDFCLPKGSKRDAELAHVRLWIDRAALLGAPVIRIFSGHADAKSGQTPAAAHRLAVEGIEAACEYAARRGVFLALENHGGLTAEADGLLKIVRDVRSPWFGINFDSGNFHSSDPYAELEKIAPYALNVQIKAVVTRGEKKTAAKEPSDYRRLAQIIRSAGYRGYIVLEYEEPGDPRVECPRVLAELREAFA